MKSNKTTVKQEAITQCNAVHLHNFRRWHLQIKFSTSPANEACRDPTSTFSFSFQPGICPPSGSWPHAIWCFPTQHPLKVKQFLSLKCTKQQSTRCKVWLWLGVQPWWQSDGYIPQGTTGTHREHSADQLNIHAFQLSSKTCGRQILSINGLAPCKYLLKILRMSASLSIWAWVKLIGQKKNRKDGWRHQWLAHTNNSYLWSHKKQDHWILW